MKFIINLLALLFYLTEIFAQHTACHHFEPEVFPREHRLDIIRVRLEVSFVPEKRLVNGRVTHQFRVLQDQTDTIFFDGPGITIEKATLGGRPLRFKTSDLGVTVYPDQPLRVGQIDSITFVYNVNPRKGIYFIGWNDPKNLSRKQIWTQGQAIDHRYWLPCYDDANDKVITETIVTFDSKYKVLSNGTKLAERDNGNGTKTWHYTMTKPHALYLMMLGIGDFKIKTLKTKAGVPVHLWYYPDHEDRFNEIYLYSTECIDFVAEHTGIPYPWESYAQIPVQDYIYGAMENTTATIFGDFFCADKREFLDRNYVTVNVHELTHQWFGDLVTGRALDQIWLQESFATFYPLLFNRKYYGEDRYQWERRSFHQSALEASKRDLLPIVNSKSGTARVYPKGAAVLDMMMYTFGEENYRRVIYHYLKRHSYKNVETNDLYQSFQDTLGITPRWFFDQWLYRGGEPHYEVKYQDVTENGKRQTLFHVRQIHAMNELVKTFKMPIVFEVHYTDGSSNRVRAWVEREQETVIVPNANSKTIAFTLFDPGCYVMKTLTFHKSFSELQAQALRAPLMIDRYEAILAMKNLPLDQKRRVLQEAYQKERFFGIKGEIIAQLISDDDADSRNLIRAAIVDKDVEVRRAVINNTKTIHLSMREDYEKLLADSSYNIVMESLEKLCFHFPEHLTRYLEKTRQEVGMAARVRIKWLEIYYAKSKDKEAQKQLVELTSNSYEFRTRINAMNAIVRLNIYTPELVKHLLDASISTNTRLGAVAETTLKHFFAQSPFKAEIWKTYQEKLPALDKAEKEILANILKL